MNKDRSKSYNKEGGNAGLEFVFNNVRIDQCNFGEKLSDWIQHGHVEQKQNGGIGCCTSTFDVIKLKHFKTDPIFASKDIWEKCGKRNAPKGSVMRIASSGFFVFLTMKL